MKRVISILAIFFLTSSFVSAQDYDYNVGLGLRFGGYTNGISAKIYFNNSKGAFEGIAGLGHQAFVITGLYEHHIPIKKVKGLVLYAGGGGHFGFFSHKSSYLVYKHKSEKVYVIEEGRTVVIPGVDGIFGIEYKFPESPFTIGADLKPFVDFYKGVSGYADGAIHVHYVF